MPSGDAWLAVAEKRLNEGQELMAQARVARWHPIRQFKLYRQAIRSFKSSRYCSNQATSEYNG